MELPVRDFTQGPDNPQQEYEQSLLRWLNEAILEGEGILKSDPAYEDIDKTIAYIMGDQLDPFRPEALSKVVDNRTKFAINQIVAALTDIHPVFGFKTDNSRFQAQGDVLTKLARAWWVNTFADLQLAHVLRYAAGPGAGYCEVSWRPEAAGSLGDIVLIPRDPRDVIPIRPVYSTSVQDWEGVAIRESKTINELQARYPEKAHLLHADRSPVAMIERAWTRTKRAFAKVSSPALDHLTKGKNRGRGVPEKVPALDVYSTYVKDRRLHTGPLPMVLGDPATTWSYTVYPIGYIKDNGERATRDDARLYPRGRLIIHTLQTVLYDGPNPYWHGMFPIAKLSLDPWPWSLLGVGIARDIIPLQDAVNQTLNGILDMVNKCLRPALIVDKKAVPESQWQRLDTRIPGLKLKVNPTAGKGVEFPPPPELPPYVFEMFQALYTEIDTLTGTANLQALTQLQQTPGADSIEKMMEALTPTLRMKGRLLEAFLRDVGEMVKADFFQFYTLPRRVAILGEAGTDFADFDFDPGTLIPSLHPEDADYSAEYDANLPRAERAKVHHKNFTFQITPNSLLAISQLSRKLLYLQLWRGGLMDPWTLFEVLEVPNAGSPPDGANTIMDRLMAAMMLGLSGNVSPAGRKASGQEAPAMEVKDGGSRQTVTES